MTMPSRHPVETLIRTVAAQIILPRFRNLADDQIVEKAPGDPVTIADREAEEALSAGLRRIDPAAAVVGEEAAAADGSVLDAVGRARVWIIDPIDGTAHFAAGRGPFGVMIAHAEHGRVMEAWIFDPLQDRMCHARRGAGTVINGARIHVSAFTGDRPVAALATHFMPEALRQSTEREAARVLDLVPVPRCAAEHYPRLCLGTNHVGLYLRTLPWDHAAGALLLEEAGGIVRRWDGTDYRLDDGKTGLLLASDPATWDVAHAAIFSPATGLDPDAPPPIV
jgi:fructose-1,6-bisphosphatase/inositol monophosphatase family enzyme